MAAIRARTPVRLDHRETCVPMGKWNKKNRRERVRDNEQRGDSGRSVRLQDLMRDELNFLLRSEIRDPRLDGVTVTMVELTGDGSCARIWFSAATDDDQVAAFERAAGFLRSQLAQSLGGKKTPELRFRRDPVTRSFFRSGEELP